MLELTEEQNLFSAGYKIIAGIDEAGRGPLAGPVVAACVALEPGFIDKLDSPEIELIKDSKKLTAKKREELAEFIMERLGEVGIGVCGHQTIDRINILQASFLAMKKAVGSLKQKPDFILLDGNLKISNCSYRQKAIIKGDELVFCIAAASIIAKVERDRIMLEMHDIYPNYGFDKHKGYGTKLHMERLKKYGPCAIHRMSFKPCARWNSRLLSRMTALPGPRLVSR